MAIQPIRSNGREGKQVEDSEGKRKKENSDEKKLCFGSDAWVKESIALCMVDARLLYYVLEDNNNCIGL